MDISNNLSYSFNFDISWTIFNIRSLPVIANTITTVCCLLKIKINWSLLNQCFVLCALRNGCFKCY